MDLSILQGKTALVTGVSSGLGVDFANEMAMRGCSLILAARRWSAAMTNWFMTMK